MIDMRLAGTAIAALVMSMPLAAQDKEYGNTLEEITVTAQKRAQNIQDVPISISAFSGSFLEDNGIETLQEVARISPNFYVNHSSQQTGVRIIMRGVGSVGNSAIEPSVGVFIDGVYYPRPGSVIGKLTDIKTVEILRGPQGTLFGRNTPMGALNITTNDPTDKKEGMFALGYGDYNALQLDAVVNTPLTDNVAGRLALKYESRDGYGKNTFDGRKFGDRDDLVLRGKLNVNFSDSTSLLLAADYARINGEGTAIEVLNSSANPRFDGTLIALFGDTATTRDSFDQIVNQDHRDDLKDEQWGVSALLNHSFANGISLRSITAYRDWKAHVYESVIRIPTNLLPRITDYQTQTFSQEFQLLSPGGETIDWVAGLFYYDESYDIVQSFDAGDTFCVPVIFALAGPGAAAACLASPQERITEGVFNQSLESLAAYGQATWNVSDTWSLTLGGRYTDDSKKGDFVQTAYNPLSVVLRAPESVLNMRRNDSKFTWFANASWHVSDAAMLFATASTGYKSGGFNADGGQVALNEKRIFGPEETLNYELGVKSKLFSDTMTANVTLFRTDLDNFQDRLFDGLSFIVVNAGKLRQQGVEADINWRPVEQLNIIAGVSYLDSEYLRFPEAPPLPGSTEPQDLKGERKTFSPKWQSSVTADWTGTLNSGMQWVVGASWQFVDDQNVGASSNNNPQSIQPGYSLFNGRIGLVAADGKWDVTLYGRNLTDKGYCIQIYDQPFGSAFGAVDPVKNTVVQRCVLGVPRTYGVKVRWWW